MKTLKDAALNTREVTYTENGMKTYNTSLNKCVDMFFKIGAIRRQLRYNSADELLDFEGAYQENPEVATRILLWSRDVRGGAGERKVFRDLLKYLEVHHKEYLEAIINITPEIGRWDDLLELDTEYGKSLAYPKILEVLNAGDGLCAKWMPRKGEKAAELRKAFKWSPKFYRKTLVGLTTVVETQMCAKDWDNIEFGKLPSLAAARYATAFDRNASGAYSKYKDGLEKGTEKINANAVYPYDVTKTIANGKYDNIEVVRAQWDAIPDYIGEELILPMIDVSGSMTSYQCTETLKCMDMAISLGLYIADKNKGSFKDMFLTFSERPRINVLKGDIISKYKQIKKADWGYNTNLQAAFKCVLDTAEKNKVPSDGMPKIMLVLSDMEFDPVAHKSAFGVIKKEYKKSGYELPRVVFWNLSSRSQAGNVPVRFDKDGTGMVSGFSPSVMEAILKAEVFTPEGIMLQAVNSERYNIFS